MTYLDERRTAAVLDWRRLLPELADVVDGYSAFLELRDGTFVSSNGPPPQVQDADVIGLALTTAGADVAPWDTEAAARHLASVLSERLGVTIPVLLSRDPHSFAGYYVRLRTREIGAVVQGRGSRRTSGCT